LKKNKSITYLPAGRQVGVLILYRLLPKDNLSANIFLTPSLKKSSRGSSVVEQMAENHCVGSSILPLGILLC
jgi:hypothetical protein